jgi:ketosteroid isomerase-like protein
VTDIEARLARLELIEQAKVAAARYGRACDAKDVDRLAAEVFTGDIVLKLPGAVHRGIEAVTGFYRAAFEAEPGTRRHFLANHVAEVNDRGEVEIESYFHFVSADAESVIGWGAYRDVVVIDADGRPRISEKTIVMDMRTTLDEGWAAAP